MTMAVIALISMHFLSLEKQIKGKNAPADGIFPRKWVWVIHQTRAHQN
jgi:hypothetical protein